MSELSRREALALALSAAAAFRLSPARAGAERVVTLGGDLTEIVFALGEGGRLAGRDSTSTWPPEAEKLPDVGYFRQLGAEGVLSLRPGLILASQSAGPREALAQIEAAGVRIVQLPDTHSPAGLLQKVKEVARELGVPGKGEALAMELGGKLEKVQAEVGQLDGRPRVLFIINAGGGAPMAAGRETAADALIRLAGGENVFTEHTGYKAISSEAAAAAAPEAIAMMEQTLGAMGGVEGVAGHPALSLTPAAKSKRIVAREGSYLLSFGPRLPEVVTDFARAIRGAA